VFDGRYVYLVPVRHMIVRFSMRIHPGDAESAARRRSCEVEPHYRAGRRSANVAVLEDPRLAQGEGELVVLNAREEPPEEGTGTRAGAVWRGGCEARRTRS